MMMFILPAAKKVFQLSYCIFGKIIEGDCSDNIDSIFKGKRIKNKELINDPEV